MEGLLVTTDTEKGFDSLDHNFLISIQEKYGFGKNFILRVKILLRDQESRVTTTMVQLQGISHLGQAPVKVTQFQLFYLF